MSSCKRDSIVALEATQGQFGLTGAPLDEGLLPVSPGIAELELAFTDVPDAVFVAIAPELCLAEAVVAELGPVERAGSPEEVFGRSCASFLGD